MTTNVTNYNELIDHLVSTMKPNSPVQDVTNSKKDWDDFWYNSDSIHPPETNNNYNELVDYQVHSMNRFESISDTMNNENIYSVPDNNPRKSFDELYEEYSSKSIPEQVNNLKQLGRDLVHKLDKIIDQIDDILEEDKKD